MLYIITLVIFCAVYSACIFLMKYMKSAAVTNAVLTALVYVPYVVLCCVVYSDVGFNDWNFRNVLPTANVSPFCFFTIPFVIVLPRGAKQHAYLLISLLTVGMFFSTVLGFLYNASINYKFHPHFLLDYVSHFSLSLLGIYLVRSGQVKPSPRGALKSGAIIFSAAGIMLILNLIFDTAFFGLSLRGKHNIYNNVLTDSSIASALIYFAGLFTVLLLGYLVCSVAKKERFMIKTASASQEDDV